VLASVCLMAALVMVNPSMVKSRAFTSEMASSNETSTVVALIAVGREMRRLWSHQGLEKDFRRNRCCVNTKT
ncbi:MAG TPA: hypothetical protein H9667_07720, partial [Firmicutes bacterium]|nr:hypothetical protein [Bacillota bacterium]